MAHRIISQVIFVGARVVGRATLEAWRQAAATSKYKASAAGDPTRSHSLQTGGLSLDEAAKILNVAAPTARIRNKFNDGGRIRTPGGKRTSERLAADAEKSGGKAARNEAEAVEGQRGEGEGEGEGGVEEISGTVSEAASSVGVDMEHVMERFKRLFDQNDPKKGGSFYLQSKVLRARERIEMEVKRVEQEIETERETQAGGWKPRMYR